MMREGTQILSRYEFADLLLSAEPGWTVEAAPVRPGGSMAGFERVRAFGKDFICTLAEHALAFSEIGLVTVSERMDVPGVADDLRRMFSAESFAADPRTSPGSRTITRSSRP